MPTQTIPSSRVADLSRLVPGLALALAVGLAALAVATLEAKALGHAVVDGLVLAILLGMVVRTAWSLPARVEEGLTFASKQVLEVAVLLLGASIDLPLLLQAGPSLAIGIVLLVVLGIAGTYAIGRALRLPHRLAILVACGNSICGNSAIAAVAPVIHAEREHIASAIAFTAILGVVVVVGLPHLASPLGLSDYQYGVLAGLSVYAVPQVLAAAFPVSILSGQVGTLVKLVRVLMLGPVVLFFTLTHRRRAGAGGAEGAGDADGAEGVGGTEGTERDEAPAPRIRLSGLVPWFILGFLALALLRSAGLIPAPLAGELKRLSGWLTLLAMAGLGLGVDLKSMRQVGAPVVITVTASLLALIGLGVGLIHLLSIA